jgi:urea transport system permease protein
MSLLLRILMLMLLSGLMPLSAEDSVRAVIAESLSKTDSDVQVVAIKSLAGRGEEATEVLRQWKEGEILIYTDEEGNKTAALPDGDTTSEGKRLLKKLADGSPLVDKEGKRLLLASSDIETADTDSAVRRAMKDVTDLAALTSADAEKRVRAVRDFGLKQEVASLPVLRTQLERETSTEVKLALDEAIALISLRSEDKQDRLTGCLRLGQLTSIPSQDALATLSREAEVSGQKDVKEAAQKALAEIRAHVTVVNTVGTVFRGLSQGSVLLVVAIGLAITFGLMGVINMAHGELLVVGAYTTYVMQNVFTMGLALSPFGVSVHVPGLGLSGNAAGWFFVVSLPLSFLSAALVGLVLERTVIRFLYNRPLESLLATWGVSLVLQQLFRLTFGANNVQVDSPAWLSGHWTVNDVLFGWNRVFVIAFAVLIIAGTWLVLNKTSLGLLIRAVMQNRGMAACMGVRTERVNMMTFAFGSGLAGLAGAFLSQIGNVGPSLGQSYIVDAFMTVVVGGVGAIAGTVLSAIGIGVADQTLQQVLGNPVLGKILVLGAIILFLQWRPAGLFVTRSRSLEG